ncbi:MAG: TlpA family protein disulfide reductase [Chitinophagaceae bacterium]|nr:TlpA family protein disulfide reductase [Chitinophagaceae bacterium]
MVLSNTVLGEDKIIRLNFSRRVIAKTEDYEAFAKVNPLITKISFWAADYSDSTVSFSLGLFVASENKILPVTDRDKLTIGAYKDTSLDIVCHFSCNYIEEKNFIRYDDSYFEVIEINTEEKYITLQQSSVEKFNMHKGAALFEYISKIPPGVLLKGLDGRFYNIEDYLDTTKYTLIQFWAYWCPPCNYSVKLANKMFDEQLPFLNIIGINSDVKSSKADILKYIEEKKIKWNVGVDEEVFSEKLLHLFGAAPLSILFDKKGKFIKLHPTLQDINNLAGK